METNTKLKVIERGTLPDGTAVQLESWGENGHDLAIAAYPVAQRSSRSYYTAAGERFRLHIGSNPYTGYTDEMVQADYVSLLAGEKSLYDLSERFWNGERDKWCLGMDTAYRP